MEDVLYNELKAATIIIFFGLLGATDKATV